MLFVGLTRTPTFINSLPFLSFFQIIFLKNQTGQRKTYALAIQTCISGKESPPN
jgi:hypothetical protein